MFFIELAITPPRLGTAHGEGAGRDYDGIVVFQRATAPNGSQATGLLFNLLHNGASFP